MKRLSERRPVYVLLTRDFLLLDLAAVVEPLRLANELGAERGFAFHYLASSQTLASSVELGVGPLEPLPDALPDDALVVAIGTRSATRGQHRKLHLELSRWLQKVLRGPQLLLCVCSGALLAADAGLLDGRECTTHHELCAELARLHPRARVQENRIFVRDGNLFTSAGVTAGIDLTLFVLGLLEGEALALKVARELVVYLRRAGDDPQLSPLLAHRNHLHPQVHRVQDAVLKEPARRWSLSELAQLAQLSPRQLSRVFRSCAGTTPAAFVTLQRLTRAAELLQSTGHSIERTAEEAGFGSTRQFRRAFEARFGQPPARWRARAG